MKARGALAAAGAALLVAAPGALARRAIPDTTGTIAVWNDQLPDWGLRWNQTGVVHVPAHGGVIYRPSRTVGSEVTEGDHRACQP